MVRPPLPTAAAGRPGTHRGRNRAIERRSTSRVRQQQRGSRWLDGRKALVTGARSGIGASCSARRLVTEGASITTLDIRPAAVTATIHDTVAGDGAQTIALRVDVAHEASVAAAVAAATVAGLAGLDTVVTSAGLVLAGRWTRWRWRSGRR